MYIQPTSPNYNVFYRSALPVSNTPNVCFCCLIEKGALINLITCKHAMFLQEFYETNSSADYFVCLLCHKMLEKIQLFQNQIRDSRMILKEKIPKAANKLINLKVTNPSIFTFTATPETIVKVELEDEVEEANENPPFEFVTDVKIEHDSSSSEFENDLPLSEVKKIVDVEPKPVKKKIVKQKQVEKIRKRKDVKYDGKIIVYTLSREELEEERERESKKESYTKLPFKCESCVKGFDHEATLKNHNAKQHSQKKNGNKCDVCKTILGLNSFKEHTRRHYRRYQCVECGRRSQDIHSLSQHYNQQHEQGAIAQLFKCDQCDFTTESNRVYRYHRDKHKQKQQCSECGNTFVSAGSLRIHVLHVHKQSSRVYTCSICDKQYNSKSGLHSHHAAAHARSSAYCVPCHTYFRTKTGLAHHLRTHSAHISKKSNQRYICNECNATYMKKATLQAHINWYHLRIVNHQCRNCNKIFKSPTALRSHERYVHELKPKPRDKICHICGRGFTTAAILRSHIRTHTGERPLACSHCSATFAHSAALYTHCKMVHKKLPKQSWH